MNIGFVYADKPQELNCSKWNVFYPSNAINKLENNQAIMMHVEQFSKNDDAVKSIMNKADIIVVERNLFGDCLTSIMYYKVRGKTVIAIFDDAYDKMHPENVSYNFWQNGEVSYLDENGREKFGTMNPKPLDQFKWGMRMVKGIQVPSYYLAKDWSEYNKTYHIPNYIEFERYVDVKPLFPHKKKDIVIGWGGSMSHVASFKNSEVIPALKSVVKKYDNVKIMITGDKRVFSLLSEIPNNKKIYNSFVPEEQFLPLMKTFDIALAPLWGEYDMRRSRIKVLEYMALKMPWVSSNFPPYEGFANFGVFAENTKESWEEKLFYMVENIDERREFASGEPYEYAYTQSYDKNIEKTLALYQKIIYEDYLT